VTDSTRTSASTELPTSVDVGTPAGHPTPAGEPPHPTDQPELFPRPPGGVDQSRAQGVDPALLQAIGGLILAWGHLEEMTAEKLADMRRSFGDVRAVGGRMRPTMQKLLAELRALVAMRDRHDKQALMVIAEMDGALQRTAQFRQLIIDGAQDSQGEDLICRDLKNSTINVSLAEIAKETMVLNRIRRQIAAL
jgi:hypothetical protein